MSAFLEGETPVLHVVVVGFHHKKGCQVEYSYPPLIAGNAVDSHNIPEIWKHLPSLALPDGAHNYKNDTIYFHLPSAEDKNRTVYAVSCYRQMDAQELLNRGADVTRNSVQKSVCVLSKLPLYGLIQAKLELITHAYFDERDFTKVSLLEDTYNNLNATLTESLLHGSHLYLGLSSRDLVQQFKHQVLVLFKLILLERKVLFFGTPSEPVCCTLLTVLSLFPGLIEKGLKDAASYSFIKKISPTLKVTQVAEDTEDYLEVHYTSSPTDCDSRGFNFKPDPKQTEPCRECEATSGRDDQESKINLQQVVQYDNEVDVSNKDMAVIVNNKDHTPFTDQSEREAIVAERDTADPLQYVEDITHVENVQKLSPQSNSDGDSITMVTAANMEELLDTDECFSWDDNRIILEINEAISEDASSDVVPSIRSGESNNILTATSDRHNSKYTKVGLSVESDKPNCKSETSTLDRDTKDSSSQSHDNDFEDLAVYSNVTLSSKDSTPSSDASSLNSKSNKLKDKGRAIWYAKSSDDDSIELINIKPLSTLSSTLLVDHSGFPLSIFTKGVLCHPYLCLQYYELLQDVNVRGFVVGATNMLFRQKRHLLDVIVEVEDVKINVHDAELRKQLNLSTADLRFADHIVTTVNEDVGNVFTEGTEWAGGDEWLRGQFQEYLTCLLCTVESGDEKLLEDFNPSFVSALKSTHNYKVWQSSRHPGLADVHLGHPCQGQLKMADMKLKLSHTMQNTERGKKINAAMAQTGKVVMDTGKAVGGAITSAKTAVSKTVSSWFGGFSKDWTPAAPSSNTDSTDDQ